VGSVERPAPAVAVVVSRYNGSVTERLLAGAKRAHQQVDVARSDALERGVGFAPVPCRRGVAQAEQREGRHARIEIVAEFAELLDQIRDLGDILARPERLLAVIREELAAMKAAYGDERRTEIISDQSDVTIEDLIERQDLVVTLSHAGYAKAQPVSDYEAQRRGGRGKMATTVKDEDFLDKLFIAHSHDTLLCFSDRGQCYWLKVWQLPLASRGSRGKPIVNLLQLGDGERITAVQAVREFDDSRFVLMATTQGTVKKTPLSAFSRPRANGIIAVSLGESDCLVDVALTDGQREILLTTTDGKAIRFSENEVRPMGREAAGVRGVRLTEGQRVTSLIVLGDGPILTVSERGFGKLTDMEEFPRHGRGGQGVIALQTSGRNGALVGALQLKPDDEIMLINSSGTLVRVPVSDVPVLGRNTQGVRIMRLEDTEKLVGLERIAGEDAGNGEGAG